MFVGLVGKSCSGKNYVGKLLEQKGYEVWDLDVLCHDALEQKENIQKVEQVFGSQVLENGAVSRQALGKIIFEKPEMRSKLENLLYPWLIKKVALQETLQPQAVVFLNGALLRRAGLDSYCNFVVYVDAPYEDRLKRALVRDGVTETSFAKREAAQEDVDFRNNQYKAPILVINNGNETKNLELIRQINIICDRISTIFKKGNEDNEEK